MSLTVPENKQQLIGLVCKEQINDDLFKEKNTKSRKLMITGEEKAPMEIAQGVVSQRVDLETSQGEADNIILFNKSWCVQ